MAVEEVGYEATSESGVVEPGEVSSVGQGVEFAVRHEGGDLPPGLDAAERIMRTPKVENRLGYRD